MKKANLKSKPKLPLQSFRLRHFKAVRNSGMVEFTPLTVFIGNNGSGKSSLIEGLETFQNIVLHGLDEAFLPWRGFEHIWNQAAPHQLKEDQIGKLERQNPMVFEIEGRWNDSAYRGAVEIGTDLEDGNQIVFTKEDLIPLVGSTPMGQPTSELQSPLWRDLVHGWQFLSLEPRLMLDPKPQARTGRDIRLAHDGSNIAQYLQSIADKEPTVLDGIAETLKAVLPFATDLRPAITRELQRNVYLRRTRAGVLAHGRYTSLEERSIGTQAPA